MEKNSNFESYCNRCNIKPIELICYECNPLNSFCRTCDSITHSLPSKKNHKRDIVNFIFQDEQQKLQKEISKMKKKNSNKNINIQNTKNISNDKHTNIDIISTPIKENSNPFHFVNKNTSNNIFYHNEEKHSKNLEVGVNFEKTSTDKLQGSFLIRKNKTIEILQKDGRKLNYENDYKINLNSSSIIGNNIEQNEYEKNDFDNNFKNSKTDFKFSKLNIEKNHNGNENLLFYENNTNFAKNLKSNYESLNNDSIYYKNVSIHKNHVNANINNNEDNKIMTISCYDCPNSLEKTHNHSNSNKNITNDINYNTIKSKTHNYNNSESNGIINGYSSSKLNSTSILNKTNSENTYKNNNNNNICINNYANEYSYNNQNNSNKILNNNYESNCSQLGDLKTTNFVTSTTSSYYSKEYVNELTSLHNREKEDLIFKMNLMQGSLERIKISLSEQMQNIQKQLEENNLTYSTKIKNLETQQKKLYEKNMWLNDQDQQKEKIIENLKMQMKKLKESNTELMEKYEYHLNACKNDKIIQQKQFDELQTKITQKEIEIEELKNYYNKKIEELIYLSTNPDKKTAAIYVDLESNNLNSTQHHQPTESEIRF